MRANPRLVGRLALAAAVISMVTMAVVGTIQLRFVSSAARATGTIVELRPSGGVEDQTLHAVFTFTPPEGPPVVVRSSVGETSPSYQVGETVRVLYDRERPSSAVIDSFIQLWFVTLMLAILALVNAAVAAAFLIGARRRGESQR